MAHSFPGVSHSLRWKGGVQAPMVLLGCRSRVWNLGFSVLGVKV